MTGSMSAGGGRTGGRLLLAALSGVMLAIPFVVPQAWLLSWFALVPLLIALDSPGMNGGKAWVLGSVAGLVLAVVASWWVPGFVERLKGYGPVLSFLSAGVLWIYSAQILGLFALAVYVTRGSRIAVLWRVAVLFALIFLVYPAQFRIRPGESQSGFLVAIQAVSLFGVHGLDVMIGLANGLAFSLIRRGSERAGQVAAVALMFVWMGFGSWQLLNLKEGSSGKALRLGLVQPDQPPVLGEPAAVAGYTHGYPPAMALSHRLADAGADLLIWPEVRFNPYFRRPELGESYRRQVAGLGVPLLFQAMEVDRAGREYNTAVYLDGAGAERQTYRKVNLVALGERAPQLPLLDGYLEDWFGGFMDHVTAGPGPVNIHTAVGPSLVPLICYDVMFPTFVAEASRTAVPAGLMVVLSNNAWFGESRQPWQHLGASVLRAVENRMPLVHVMNNGPSAVITARGDVGFRSAIGEQAGFLVEVNVPEHRVATFYQVVPWLTPALLWAGGVLLALATLARKRRVAGSESGL